MIVNGIRSIVSVCPIASAVAAEAPLPEAVTDDGDRTVRAAAALVVGFRERAAEHRRHAERVEHPAARPDAVDELRLAALREVEALRAPRERVVEERRGAGGLSPRWDWSTN